MKRVLTPVILVALVGGCKVVDAPDTLEALMVFGFTHVEPGPEIEAFANELPALVKRNREDLEAGYRVDSLTRPDLTAAGVDGEGKVEIVGAMGRVEYLNDLDAVVDAITHRHRDVIVDNTTFFEVIEETDRGCFLRRECDTYFQKNEQVTKQPVIGELTQTFAQEWVWVESEGREAVASRVLAPDPVEFSSGLVKVDQQYSFYLVSQQPGGGVERVEAIWAEAKLLSGDLPDAFLVDSAVGAMGKQAEKVDAWIDGE